MAINKQHFSSLDSTANNMYRLTSEDIRNLHSVLLDMYKDINEVCKKYDIHLIAAGGTALGAIRHKGFIPWDDDMDLFIFRTEFLLLSKIFEKELGNKYLLLNPGDSKGANCFLPRIMKRNTTFLGMVDESSPYPHGIYLDINIIEFAPENNIKYLIKAFCCNALRLISYSVYWKQYPSKSFRFFMLNSKGKFYYKIRIIIGYIFGWIKAEKWFAWFDKYGQYKETNLITIPSGTKKYKGETLPLSTVMPLQMVDFEDTQINVFNDYDKYLSNLYGNYMEIPNVKHREYHLCLKLSFTEM